MQRFILLFSALLVLAACQSTSENSSTQTTDSETTSEPSPTERKPINYEPLFADDLSNAIFPEGIWSYENGELTATEDQFIWTEKEYDNFVVDLEFKTASGTNSGVVVYCSDLDNWVANAVEIQIADDYHPEWSSKPTTWQCGAIFGHLPARAQKIVKEPGNWNHMRIVCKDQNITVDLNSKRVNDMDMSLWTSGTTNPDGTEIPSWMSTPFAELPTRGKIGLQGKHAGAPIWFRNMKVREI